MSPYVLVHRNCITVLTGKGGHTVNELEGPCEQADW